jgi:hypothetical protein
MHLYCGSFIENVPVVYIAINTIISRGYWGHSNFETSIREVTPIDED